MQTIKIGDACEILNGYAFKSENYVDAGIRIIRISNVQSGFIEDKSPVFYPLDSEEVKNYMLNEGDLLVSLTGNVGRVGILKKKFMPAALNQRVGCLRLKNNLLNKRYLFYSINNRLFENKCIMSAKGIAQKNMSASWLADYEIPLYSMEKQLRIVRILDNITSIIQKKNREILLLEAVIKARFIELFGDPIINSKQLETKALKELLTLKAGEFTAASNISDKPSKTNPYPCYGGNGIRGYVSEYNQEGEYSLVGRQGALSGNVQFANGKFKNTEHALLVMPKVEMNNIWLNQLLLNLDLKRYQTGAAQPGISVKNLQEIQIICVPIDKQNQFASFVEKVDKSKVD